MTEIVEPWTADDKEFWEQIVCPNGIWDIDQVKRELHDYYLLLRTVPLVYDHVTGSRISKPMASATAVIEAADERCQRQIDDAIFEERLESELLRDWTGGTHS